MGKYQRIPEYFFLTIKEEEVIKVLWEKDSPKSAKEIHETLTNWKWSLASIHHTLNSLQRKGAIKVVEHRRTEGAYARLFSATLTANEYVTLNLERFYQPKAHDNLVVLSALLGKIQGSQKEVVKLFKRFIAISNKE